MIFSWAFLSSVPRVTQELGGRGGGRCSTGAKVCCVAKHAPGFSPKHALPSWQDVWTRPTKKPIRFCVCVVAYRKTLLHPVGHEDVGFARWDAVDAAVRREDELRAVEAEHGEGVERVRVRDLCEAGAIDINHEDGEVSAAAVVMVRREENTLAIRVEERRPVGAGQIRHALLVGSVGIHHVDVELAWFDDALLE